MENRRSKAFLVILTVLLCLSVCVGLTYAYFTDSAKSNGNKIQAGNLKLDLKLYDKVDDEWISIKNTEDPVFNYDKWEPGYVDAKLLKIENLGDLAMQWEAKLVSAETVSAFANAIEVYVQKSNTEIAYPADRAAALAWTKVGTLDQFINTAEKLANGTFTAQGEAYYIGIAFYMPAEITDNTLQGQVLGAFDIQINATQLAYESDAFDENYDPDATFPNGGVTPPGETESESDTTTSSSEPEPTDTSSNEPTDEPEPTDPDIFTWSENGDGTYTVTGLRDDIVEVPENLVIPSTYMGLPVTAIGNGAFYYHPEYSALPIAIQSVIVPDSVTTIGEFAFYDCSGLTELTIPDSVTTIGHAAFTGCNGLTSITVAAENTAYYSIDNCLIERESNTLIIGCNNNSSIIPDDVTTIGSDAFNCCYRLTSIELPDSVSVIGGYAFSNCSRLTRITFKGTIEQWNAIEFGSQWNNFTGDYTIYCTDGTIAKDGTVTYN